MAVPEQTPYIEHTGNGATTSFSLGFQCESKDHLIVLVDEIEPPIATWSLTGGNVVFTTAPAAGKKITIQRNTPFGRTTNYQSFNNSFRPQTVNIDFDRIWWKLQELGVADWLMKLYVDRLHQQQEQKINDLKVYVDDRDDELRAYLMEEIRKQGVALDQLDEYYNYLMQRLAQIAVDKGWDASFVVDGDKTQKQINDELRIFSTPKMFGAKGDGITDDTLALQEMFDQKGLIVIPDGNYWLNPAIGLTIKSDTICYISDGVIIKNLPHNLTTYQMFRIHDCVNAKLVGGLIDGNKSQNSATSGEHGHGISIRGSTNVTIDTRIQNCWGDGLYIGRTGESSACININIPNLTTSGNRRQGISIISVNGLNGGTWTISDIGGTLPESGVDFEPNFADEVLLNIEIDTIIAKGISGNGLEINLSRFKNTSGGTIPKIVNDTQKVGIHIKSLEVSNTAKRAVSAVNSDLDFAKGYIKVDSIISRNNGLIDVQVTNWSPESVDVKFGDLFVYTNQDKVVYNPCRTSGQDASFPFGGVSVESISIYYDDVTPTASPIEVHIGTPATNPIKNVSIGDIEINRDVAAIKKSINTLENVNIKTSSYTSRKFTTNVTVSNSNQRSVDYYEYIAEPTEANPYPTLTITEISKGHKFKITGGGANGARLRISAGVEIIGINSNGGNVTYNVPLGESIYVEAVDNQKVLLTPQGFNISNNAVNPSLSLESFIVPANSSVSKYIPHYNLGLLNSVFVSFNTFIGNVMVQAVKDAANNRVTVRFINTSSADVTVPTVTAIVGSGG